MKKRARLTLGLVLLSCAPALADGPSARPTTYAEQVAPILEQSCTYCHDAKDPSGGLDLSSYAGILQGGGSGAVIVPGDPGASRLLRLVTRQEKPFMPADGSEVAPDAIAALRRWIADGALEVAGGPAARPRLTTPALASATSRPSSTAAVSSSLPGPLPLGGVAVPAHAPSVLAMATSPVAPLLAVAGQGAVLLHDARTDVLIGVLPFTPGRIHALRFSADGRLLLAAGGQGATSGRLVLYEVASGLPRVVLDEPRDEVLAADVQDDLARVAMGGPSRVVDARDAASGELAFRLEAHTDWVTALGYSPDGVLLATGDRAGGVHVWEADTGNEYLDLEGHGAAVNAIAWRRDGDVLVTAASSGRLRLVSAQDGKKLKEWEAHPGGALAVTFLPDGRLASTGRDRTVAIWAADGREERRLGPLADAGLCVAVTNDGARLFAGDWTGRVHAWRLPLAPAGRPPAPAPPTASWPAQAVDLDAQRAASMDALARATAARESRARALADLRPPAEVVDRDARRRLDAAAAAVTSASEVEARAQRATARWDAEVELAARHRALRVAGEGLDVARGRAATARADRLEADARARESGVIARGAVADSAAARDRAAAGRRVLADRLEQATTIHTRLADASARVRDRAAELAVAEAEAAGLPGDRARAVRRVERARASHYAALDARQALDGARARVERDVTAARDDLERLGADPALASAADRVRGASADADASAAASVGEAAAAAALDRAVSGQEACTAAFEDVRARVAALR